MRNDTGTEEALRTLAGRFASLRWSSYRLSVDGRDETVQRWLGDEDEEVMVCVFSGREYRERFHRQDYFFLNYAWRGAYDAVSQRSGNAVRIREGECYVAQPFSGYAIRAGDRGPCTIVGVLVRKETFHKTFLPFLVDDERLLRFFLGARDNRFADECIHLHIPPASPFRAILGLMAAEYAAKGEGSQSVLKPLAASLLMVFAREFRRADREDGGGSAPIEELVLRQASERLSAVTLAELADRFGYHPNYLSALLRRRLGRPFGRVLAELRLDRARMLLDNTALSVEDVSAMVGYSEPSAFYKAWKNRFGAPPRARTAAAAKRRAPAARR